MIAVVFPTPYALSIKIINTNSFFSSENQYLLIELSGMSVTLTPSDKKNSKNFKSSSDKARWSKSSNFHLKKLPLAYIL